MTAKNKTGKPSDDDLAVMLGQALYHADGYESDEWATNMRDALKYYLARPRGDEQEGRSQVISTDVADMVEAILANIMPSFAGDSVVTFEANAQDDEDQAQLESDVVSQVIMEDNRGFVLLYEATKDALLLKNGIIKVWVDVEETVRTESFEDLTDVELVQVLESTDNVTAELLDQEPGDEGTNVRVRYRQRKETLTVSAVPPENFKVEQNFDSIFLDGCAFVAERHQKSRSDLLKMGFDKRKVMELPRMTPTDEQSTERNLRQEQTQESAFQVAQEMVEVYECYYEVDTTGDGMTELVKAWINGPESTVLLAWEPVDFIPYAAGSPFLNPHRFLGYSIYDKEAAVQDVKTAALRQYLDNAGNNNVNRAAILEGQVNMADATNGRSGGFIRVKSQGAYDPIPVNDIGPSMLALLGYMDKIRSERGGASLDLQSGEAQLVGGQVGSQGVDRIYSSKEQLAGLITRTLAETLIRSTWLLVHMTLRSQVTGKFSFKRAGEWIETDPSTWPERNRVNIKIGLSPSERARKQGNLQQILQTQLQLLGSGGDGIIVTLDHVHNAMIDWARSADVDAPEQYWLDPSSPESQQAQQAQQRAAERAAAEQKAEQDRIVALQVQLAQANLNNDAWSTLIELQFKYFDAVLNSEVEEAKLMAEQINSQLQGMQNAGRAEAAQIGAAANNGAGQGGI